MGAFGRFINRFNKMSIQYISDFQFFFNECPRKNYYLILMFFINISCIMYILKYKFNIFRYKIIYFYLSICQKCEKIFNINLYASNAKFY